jgi:large subunit ribosomal protein L24e
MKRNPRKVKWTKAFRRAAGKDMVVDSTLEFEKRRNIPVRYDRDLMQTTLKAMKRVQEIKQKRERVFYKQRYIPIYERMAGKKEQELQESIKQLQKNLELVDGDEVKAKIMEQTAESVQNTDMELI